MIFLLVNKFINNYYNKELGQDKDWVIYTDTDSCFTSALPIIKHRYPNIDENDDAIMTKATLEVCSEVQTYVNKMFDVIAKDMFNLKKHGFDAKQEVVAKTSFFLIKKRYTQLIINKGGVPCDELEIKGIDVVRTSFPLKFRNFMNKFVVDILKKVPKSKIDEEILDIQRDMEKSSIIEVAKNTSVKFISQDKATNYDPPNRSPFNFIKGTPAQVKAGLGYNDLLVHMKLSKKHQKIMHGQKIKWVYLAENPYGLEALAMKADGTDPKPILQFIEDYIDKKAMYKYELKGKLEDFYKVLNWTYPDENTANAAKFFIFD